MGWIKASSSVQGTSHIDTDTDCQDYSLIDVLPPEKDSETPCLVACVSDGAGSAKYSQIGSELACRVFYEAVREDKFRFEDKDHRDSGQTKVSEKLVERWVSGWVVKIREAIDDAAKDRGLPVRQFACTFLGAVVFNNLAVYLQIGDGAIVNDEGGELSEVFWPQSGEYANTTNFITSEDYEKHLLIRVSHVEANRLAIFSDGIERLALDFKNRQVYQPFLLPLFESMASCDPEVDLNAPLDRFLASHPVNERTDDDKSLILASRTKDRCDEAENT